MYNPQKTFDRIKERREASGISMNELNSACEVNKNTIATSANSKSGLSAKILYDIANYLDVSVDYLLGRTEKSSSSELTENEQEILYYFSKLTIEQQLKLIGRAEALADQNEAEAVKKDKAS